jgi:hypothetical protein
LKKCKSCKKENIRERNGLPISKLCTACKKLKCIEKKEKHTLTKVYAKKRFKTLHKKAWNLFSLYVRKQSSDDFGRNTCFTCGVVAGYRELQAGHFIHGKLDFDIRNIRCQCSKCNLYLSGSLGVYGLKLAKKYGIEWLEKLYLDSNTITYSIEDLENIIETYK